MIKVSFSGANELFFQVRGFLIGPISTGRPDECIYRRWDLDSLVQGASHHKEKGVLNLQLKADLKQVNTFSGFEPYPTVAYPEQIRFDGKNFSCGYCSSNNSGRIFLGGKPAGLECDYNGHTIDIYRANTLNATSWRVYNRYHFQYQITRVVGSTIYYKERSRQSADGHISHVLNLTNKPSPGLVRGDVLKHNSAVFGEWSAEKSQKGTIGSLSTFDEDAVHSQMTLVGVLLFPKLFELQESDWGDLAATAASNINVININLIEFLSDLRNPKSLIPKLRNLRSVKGWANTYLGAKFGILPTISDLKSIYRGMKKRKGWVDRNGFTTASAGSIQSSNSDNIATELSQHLKLAVDNNEQGFKLLVRKLDGVGLLPNADRIWQVLPLSFVVDWFADIGDYLDAYSTQGRIGRFSIRYVTMSVKRTVTLTLRGEDDGFQGTIQLVYYRRWVTGHCPLPSPNLSIHTPTSNHWLDATALIVQRKR